MQKLTISILYDGAEDEEKAKAAAEGRELPLIYEEIEAALKAKGHEVRRLAAVGSALDLARLVAEDDSDIIFNNCEGFGGRGDQEWNVAALLELSGKRFTGSGSIGLALAGDKSLSKMLLGFHGIATPKFAVMTEGEADHVDDLSFPMFIKPANADSSIGIDAGSLVRNVKELLERIGYIEREFNAPALIEEYIDGREIYVGVMGGEKPYALPVLEQDLSAMPEGAPKIATAEAKYDKDHPVYQTPLSAPDDLPEAVIARLQDAALQSYRALKLRDYGRVDMRLRLKSGADKTDPEGWEFYLIEVNPNPQVSKDAELAFGSGVMGISHEDMIERIVEAAMSRPIR